MQYDHHCRRGRLAACFSREILSRISVCDSSICWCGGQKYVRKPHRPGQDCAQMAIEAPPTPMTVIFLPVISCPASRTDCIKPYPSVLYPINFPLSFSTVLTAPISWASGERSSNNSTIFILIRHGKVETANAASL